MVSREALEERMLASLDKLTQILAQRSRSKDNHKEVVDLDRDMAYILERIQKDIKAASKIFVNGFLHNSAIHKMIREERIAQVAYLHRVAIRLQEFYQGRKGWGGRFKPLWEIRCIVRKQSRMSDSHLIWSIEEELKVRLTALHEYYQEYRNDFQDLIRREGADLLRFEGVGNNDSDHVINDILASYISFLRGIRGAEGGKRKTSQILKASILAGMTLLNNGANQSISPGDVRARAEVQMETDGITQEQRATYIPLVNDLLHRGVLPYSYDSDEKVLNLIKNLITGRRGSIKEGKTGREIASPAREDAWRIYLGIPQEHNTFGISRYVPDGFEGKYCYSINGWFSIFFGYMPPAQWIERFVDSNARGLKETFGDAADVMGRHKIGLGKDSKGHFIYYHDVWDLAIPPENNKGFFGKPFVLYDRLYYDPDTYEPLENLEPVDGNFSYEDVVM